MLILLSNSQPLTLANVSFNLTLASPIDGENAGSYVFSVSVPYEGNAALFGFPYRLTRLSTVKATTQGQIVYNGVHVQSGFWVTPTNEESVIIN